MPEANAVTTPTIPPLEMPFIPPSQPGAPQPDPLAMALRDPEMLAATTVPYLPPTTRPAPAPRTEPEFDAKRMVEATKRRVDNPVYGHMPQVTAEGKAAIEAARTEMRSKRRRNTIFGWVMGVAFFGAFVAIGSATYFAYQHDQAAQQALREARAAADSAARQAGDAPRDPASLGQSVENATGSDELPELTVADVLPPEIALVASRLESAARFERYVVEIADLMLANPDAAGAWSARLAALPQADPASPGLAVLPAVASGQVAIAFQQSDDQVTRLVVLGSSPDLHVDL